MECPSLAFVVRKAVSILEGRPMLGHVLTLTCLPFVCAAADSFQLTNSLSMAHFPTEAAHHHHPVAQLLLAAQYRSKGVRPSHLNARQGVRLSCMPVKEGGGEYGLD